MNELISIQTYEQLKNKLNEELTQAANSFVRIGFLLKLARDNKDILDGSGYADVNEFASKEFGLDKTQVSRFIRINDRFSIDGNSTQLLPEYAEYGSAKLSLMLTLPDEINEELSPEMSKSDIQAIKDDYDEEQKISQIEVVLEQKDDDEPDEFLKSVAKHLNDEHEEPIVFLHSTLELAKKTGIEADEADIKEAYMPDGDKTYNIRIPGQGRFMVNMKESGITIVNMRDPSIKTPVTWEEFREHVLKDEATREFKPEEKQPEKPKTGKKVEKSKPKVAPVQPKEEEKSPDPEENAQNPEENAQNEAAGEEKPTDAAGEIEKVEGEVVGGPELKDTVLEMIMAASKELTTTIKPNWGYVKNKLQDAIREINIRA